MRLSIDQMKAIAEVQQRELPWDLELEIGGECHKVRPLTNADLMAIANAGMVTRVEQIQEQVLGLFEQKTTALKIAMDLDTCEWVVKAIGAYFAERVKKKSHIKEGVIETHVKAATTTSAARS